MDKIKKLSQAIRVGASFREQAFGNFFQAGKSCALGAALEALGIVKEVKQTTWGLSNSSCSDAMGTLVQRFPFLKEITHRTPGEDYSQVIVDLNDHDEWSREKIADWLEEQGY